MVSYKIVLDRRVRKKDLPLIPKKDRQRIVEKISALAQNPYPVESLQLKGRQERRIRQGNYRILYVVEDKLVTVFVVKVGHRRQIYR